ncbi:MAG: type III-B CRISPR module RAMP protein Cmr4 [Armatimonadetes bacterium]|nr:type III-B CRISPR module RAMP protein Cmr4 [Armatimonadota bacterium]
MSNKNNNQAPVPKLLALYAETSVHPGTGQTTGAVDLPVQRERHTGIPVIPATGLKGSLRELAERVWGRAAPDVIRLFGPEVGAGDGLYAGAIAFGEARLLAFPVRSFPKVFVWVTCPLVLHRLSREIKMMGGAACPQMPPEVAEATAVVAQGSGFTDKLVLEDLTFATEASPDWNSAEKWVGTTFLPGGQEYEYVRARFSTHCVLVPDADFQYLVRHTTQVAARVALTERKTASDGNLWYEESLPRDCLFYAWVRCEKSRDAEGSLAPVEVADKLAQLIEESRYVQVGGNETVGQGWCAITIRDVPQGGEA